ncbi:MAG: helix-turn-helix domain-containing protein [Acidimicrobiales bacterium]
MARLRRKLNKSSLAAAIGVTALTVTNYEKGVHDPKPEMIDRLSAVLGFPKSFFFRDLGSEPIPVNAASFRALSRMSASVRDAALAGGELCVAFNQWTEGLFDLPAIDLPELDPGIIEPEGASLMVRSLWGLGNLPIQNVLHELEAHGVRVFSLGQQCHELDAFSFWRNNVPYILLGVHKAPERAIFDLAHELGHLILHRNLVRPSGRQEENEANAFASNFLMPRADIEAQGFRYPTLTQLIDAKGRWKVSTAALAYRLHDLKHISDWEYREMFKDIAVFLKKSEPKSLPREHSVILSTVMSTMRSEGMRRADIAEAALSTYPADLEEFLTELTVSSLEGGGEATETARPILRLVQ